MTLSSRDFGLCPQNCFMYDLFTEICDDIDSFVALIIVFSLPFGWQDTAGEEKFAPISALYCRQASAAILAYDITDARSFESLKNVFIPLLENVDGACLTVVIGCKSDLSDESRKAVSAEEGKTLAITQHASQLERARKQSAACTLEKVDAGDSFFETSALSGKNVEEVFTYIQKVLVPPGEIPAPPRNVLYSGAVNLEQPKELNKKKCC